MAIHQFESHKETVPAIPHQSGGFIETEPLIAPQMPGLPDGRKKIDVVKPAEVDIHVEDVRPALLPGYHYLDEAMLAYFSKIRIPTKDSYRFMDVKIAGGDKTIFVWQEEFKKTGRIQLPVMSINRTGEQFNEMKFSPPYIEENRRFSTQDKTRLELFYRPTPSLVSYQLTIWAEHKRDAEYALHDIRTRFNPLAEFKAQDERIQGTIQLRYQGMTDSSDKEAAASVRANVRYDMNVVAEAWLSLSSKLVPAVIGTVTQLQEYGGEVFGTFFGSDFSEYKPT